MTIFVIPQEWLLLQRKTEETKKRFLLLFCIVASYSYLCDEIQNLRIRWQTKNLATFIY